ncbi:hypothetical protein GCM10025859_15720 [Alicyclobacillus fastidiosus]|nr:hypothetical protein GCM10025859_15720 [Alicyclobacillus fastidiosus]
MNWGWNESLLGLKGDAYGTGTNANKNRYKSARQKESEYKDAPHLVYVSTS